MTYIWEVLLKADELKFPRKNLYFIQTTTPTPYMEVASDDINRDYIDETPIEVNAFYRFSQIFESIINETEYKEYKETLYDIIMHFLAEINMYEGLCKKEYHGLFLYDDVKSGKFGQQYKDVFQTFTQEQTSFVTESMVRLYEIGQPLTLFKSLIRKLYPKSIIYLDTLEQRELLVYIGKKETQELRKQVDFLLSMFVPFDYVIHLFWDMHFGLIDIKETLELDEFVIY